MAPKPPAALDLPRTFGAPAAFRNETHGDVCWEAPVRDADLMLRDGGGPVPFGRTFVHSEPFRVLFREGMGLVEETAAYLDGPGRQESRKLNRHAGLTYASESMRLTTRLMQIASWLLVQRAVAEGEITQAQAAAEKNRVRLTGQDAGSAPADFEVLPERLQELIYASRRLHARIMHLDRLISNDGSAPAGRDSPVARQHGLIRSAFGQSR
jgi:regulator of CtrA degradation